MFRKSSEFWKRFENIKNDYFQWFQYDKYGNKREGIIPRQDGFRPN